MRDLTDLRKLHSSKWLKYPAEVLPLHVAEMDFEVDPGVRALLAEMVMNSDLGYLGPIPEVPAAFVGFAQRHWGWTPDPAQIRMTTDQKVRGSNPFGRTLLFLISRRAYRLNCSYFLC